MVARTLIAVAVAVAVAAAIASACAPGGTPANPTAAPPPTSPSSPASPKQAATAPAPPPTGAVAAAPWAAQACTVGAPQLGTVACVNGAAIDAERVRMAWHLHPQWSVEQVVAATIDEEIIAQAAAAAGLWRSPTVVRAHHQALAQTLLDRAMQRVQPATLADADIATAYKNQAVRAHYDHADAYFAVDAQVLCCSGSPQQCMAREEVRTCIDKAEAIIRDIYSELQNNPPATAMEMWGRCKAMAARYPDVAAAEVQFFYDKSKSHDQQKGYDIMVQEYAEAVTALLPGQLSAPIRSAFGWHISFLDKVDPARHADWRDPAVRAEIAANIVQPVRTREAQRFVFAHMKPREATYFFERIDHIAGVQPAKTEGNAVDDL
ncbi:MAG: hypothetical protein EXR77_12185 [Myxococcales bacterium]|nr:hypothetical protein [Myxococcales bacterium]